MSTTDKNSTDISYFNNRGQICVYEKYKYLKFLEIIPWSYVSRILFTGDKTATCAICISKVQLPRVDRCGHIFCLKCLISLFKHQRTDSVNCPLCKTYELRLSNLKRVKMIECKDFAVGDYVNLNLIAKGISSFIPRSGYKLIDQHSNALSQSLDEFNYSYVSYDYDKKTERLIDMDIRYVEIKKMSIVDMFGEETHQDLLNFLHEEKMTFYGFKQVIDNDFETERIKSGIKFNLLRFKEYRDKFDLYYQSSKSKYMLLEQSEVIKILNEYAELDRSPPVKIRGKIMEIKTLTSTPKLLETYNIQHISVGATVTWIKFDPTSVNNVFLFGEPLKKLRNHKLNCLRMERKCMESEKQKNLERESRTLQEKYLPNVIKNKIKQESHIKESLWDLEQERAEVIAQKEKLAESFNTCMLGIECVVPDDDYPHSENCIYYKKEDLEKLFIDNQDSESIYNANGPPEISDEEYENYIGACCSSLAASHGHNENINGESKWVLRSQKDPLNQLNPIMANDDDKAKSVPLGPLNSVNNCSNSAQPSYCVDETVLQNPYLKPPSNNLNIYVVEPKPKSQREMKNKRKAAKKC